MGYNQRLRACEGALVSSLFNPMFNLSCVESSFHHAAFNAINAYKEPSWLFNKIKSHLLNVACTVRTMR